MPELIASTPGPNVLQNIFDLPKFEGIEDRFTAAWGYVLDREPALAQTVADILLHARGSTAKVIRVTDHPFCGSPKKPDFRIECEGGLEILVEHKLDALLHANQLESYLDLASRNTLLALIAPAYQSVPAAVLGDPRFLKPEGKEHFRWSDFYDAVKSQPGWLAQEFADHMKSLGMAPFTLRNSEDIFDRRARPAQFEETLKLAADRVFVLNNPGCWLKGTPTGLGREVRAPGANLTLIYIWAEQCSTYVPECDGPVLAVNVYEADIEAKAAAGNAMLTTSSALSVRRHQLDKPLKQGKGLCRVTYASPLVDIVQDTQEATVLRMAEILSVIRDDFVENQASESITRS